MRYDNDYLGRKRGIFERMVKFRNYKNTTLLSSLSVLVSLTIVMVLIGNLGSQNVYSHANPTSYAPPSNSVVGVSGALPDKVVIAYTERPEPKASFIRVTDSENQRVDKNDYGISASNPREASVSIDSSKLKPGVYTVSWLALSKDDGHITRGSYVFTVSAGSNTTESNRPVVAGNNFSDSVIVDNINITSKISPFFSGVNNNFTISLSDSNGNGPTNIKSVFLIFSNKEAGLGPISTELSKTKDGEYGGSGSYLGQPGEWEAKIAIQRTDAYDLNHSFNFNIQNPP
jgi:methionine-rich copper-binding protein CopC